MKISKGWNVRMSKPKILTLNDTLNSYDKVIGNQIARSGKSVFKTRVIGGYGYLGQNELGEVLFEEKRFDDQNMIVLGGALFVLEKVFNVISPLTVAYLNDIMGIATDGPPITETYPKGNGVCLFGVGIGGAGDTITSVHDVRFVDREIDDMIPFRQTDQPLDAADVDKYWFRRTEGDGKISYFLKRFETDPVIKVLWADGEGDEDGTEVEPDVHNTSRTDPIETFVEMILKISKLDCREYFENIGEIEKARINSIGLFTGVKGELDDGSEDYKQVKMFSKININNEMLTTNKDLTIVYRIYTS